jgi:hypothetical protein
LLPPGYPWFYWFCQMSSGICGDGLERNFLISYRSSKLRIFPGQRWRLSHKYASQLHFSPGINSMSFIWVFWTSYPSIDFETGAAIVLSTYSG